MKRIYIPILACLLLTACQQPSPTGTPDINATIDAGVTQALAAQATGTSIQAAIVQTLSAISTEPGSTPTQSAASATPGAGQMSEDTPTLESPPTTSNSTPQIKFTVVPALDSSGDIQGKVEGVNPDIYGVAVYIKVGGGWWTKPYFDTPVTIIDSVGNWNCSCFTGGSDTSATVIRAYLIPLAYSPPAMSGGPSLPSVLAKNAVAWVEATR